MILLIVFVFCAALVLLALSGKLWDSDWLRRSGRELVICWGLASVLSLFAVGFRDDALISILTAATVGAVLGPCLWLIYRIGRFLFLS